MYLFDFLALACNSVYYLLFGLTQVLNRPDKNFYIAQISLLILPILFNIKSGICAMTNLTVEYTHKASLTLYNIFMVIGLALTKGQVPDPDWLILFKHSVLCILLPFSIVKWSQFVHNPKHITIYYIAALTSVVNSLLFASIDIQNIIPMFTQKTSAPNNIPVYTETKKYRTAVLAFLLVIGFGILAITCLTSFFIANKIR